MMELSNKTIFAILAVTLVITITGTFVNLSKIYDFGYLGLTGAAVSTDQGNATITISQQTSITNNFNDIQFGSGYVNSSCTVCNMDSNGSGNFGCCGTFNWTRGSTTGNFSGFLLENTGNINLSLNYTCAGNCTAAQFIGGTSPAFQIRATTNFNSQQSGEVSAIDSSASCGGGTTNGLLNLSTYVAVAAVGDFICGNTTTYPLSFLSALDAIVIDLNVSIPEDAPVGTGQKITYFTFNALATG